MKFMRFVAVGTFLVAGMAGQAKAAAYGTVTMNTPGVNLGLGQQSFYFDWGAAGGGDVFNGSVSSAGRFGFNYSSPSAGVPWPLSTWGFCIETESSSSSNLLYNVLSVDASPVTHGPVTPAAGGPMGGGKADLLAELWGRHIGGVVDGSSAAAFQMAVWEIVHEDIPVLLGVGAYDVTGGSYFRVTSPSAAYTTAAGTANTWLASLDGTGPKATLYALSRNGNQDFIVEGAPVPEPGTLTLLGFGAAALLRRRRRN